jgi:lipoprotein-anchoring transpeptidase ErfK/SrfK
MRDVGSRSQLRTAALSGLVLAAFVVSDGAVAQNYPPSRYGYDPYPPGYVPRGYDPYARSYDFYDRYGPYRRRPPVVREEERPRKSKREPFDQAKPELATKTDKPIKGPYQIVVSINAQRVSLYGSDGLIRTSAVSTGMRGHPTPMGVFTVIGKERYHRSNIYSNAPMPYMQRITWSGVALHEGVLPGYPASHGCIRVGSDFAIFLWKTTKIGTRVVITQDEPVPTEIAHPKLFAPAPAPRAVAPAAVASDVKSMIGAAKTIVKNDNEPDLLVTLNPGPQYVTETPFSKVRFEPYRSGPLSVFVSRKTGKLYARYDYEPLFEAPVTIKDPERPLGTHVYTAMETADGAMRWNAISIPTRARGELEAVKARKGERITAALTERDVGDSREAQTAQAALERIEIAPAVRERIAELLSVGSSLTVSDYGISQETGRETDFIILTK